MPTRRVIKTEPPPVQHGSIFRWDSQDESVYREVFVQNCYRLPDRFETSDVIVDVGGNCGFFAWACTRRGSSRVFSYEPDYQNYWRMQKLCATINGHEKWRQYHKAVWRSDKKEQVRLTRRAPCLTAMSTCCEPSGQKVESIGLDEILDRFAEVRFLKVDAEGAEYPIILTSQKLRTCKEIAVEVHTQLYPRWSELNCTWQALLAKIRAAGFEATYEPDRKAPDFIGMIRAKRIDLPEDPGRNP